jgi:SRSO17 transposase
MNATVLPYAESLLNQLNVFRFCFTKPQYNNFCQLTSGIALSEHSAVSRISELFEQRDQSSLNRFLTESPWDETLVKQRLHKILFRQIPELSVFIGDDTLSDKPFAKKMQGTASHYSSMKKKNENGHSIVTSGFYHPNGFVPFDLSPYFTKEGSQKLGKPFKTKNDLMCETIDTVSVEHKPHVMLFDSWYSNTQIIQKLRTYNIHYITQIKSNRNVTIKYRKRQAADHAKNVSFTEYVTFSVNGELFRVHEKDGFISGLGTVKILFSQMLRENETGEKVWTEFHYLITDMLELSAQEIIETYLKRFSIESFHREAKQQLGLDAYQFTRIRGIERYLFLVLLVYTLLMLLNKKLSKTVGLGKKTIGELRTFLRQESYTTLLRRAKVQNTAHTNLIASKLAIAF